MSFFLLHFVVNNIRNGYSVRCIIIIDFFAIVRLTTFAFIPGGSDHTIVKIFQPFIAFNLFIVPAALLQQFIFSIRDIQRYRHIATIAVGIFSILVAELSTVEDLARLVNFGALTSFILLNLAVYNFFWRREKMRGGKALLNYVICPFCGVLILGYVWLSFDSMTQIVGFSWLAIGLVIGYVKSKGYKVVPEAFRKSDMV